MAVAFQNTMAAKVGGQTLHTAADIPVDASQGSAQGKKDIGSLFIRIQSCRWILIDEVSMIGAELLSHFDMNITDATHEHSPYTLRKMGRRGHLGAGT